MTLHVVTFKWHSPTYREKYGASHVNALAEMVRRYMDDSARVVCVTDDDRGISLCDVHPLWKDLSGLRSQHSQRLPSCYRRLKLFDPATQAEMGIKAGDRIAMLDLDLVITGDPSPLWNRPDSFVGWGQTGSHPGGILNGSMWLLQAGAHANVWTDFHFRRSPMLAQVSGYSGSDQGWLGYKLKGKVAEWGPGDGVRSYSREVLPLGTDLPPNTRVVVFHGKTKPWTTGIYKDAPWLAYHYPRGPADLTKLWPPRAHATVPPAGPNDRLNVILWKWNQTGYRETFTAQHVNRVARHFTRHYSGGHRIICVTDDPTGLEVETFPLWSDHQSMINISGAQLPSCYRRLKLFDPLTQAAMGIAPGERILSMDLDTLITGNLDPLFEGDAGFKGWLVAGHNRPIVFNGSMWMLRAGQHVDIWQDFDPLRSPREALHAGCQGSDQGWLTYRMFRLGQPEGWTRRDGVYSYSRDVRANQRRLPPDARVVFFPGKRKPWHPAVHHEAPWIKQYWERT